MPSAAKRHETDGRAAFPQPILGADRKKAIHVERDQTPRWTCSASSSSLGPSTSTFRWPVAHPHGRRRAGVRPRACHPSRTVPKPRRRARSPSREIGRSAAKPPEGPRPSRPRRAPAPYSKTASACRCVFRLPSRRQFPTRPGFPFSWSPLLFGSPPPTNPLSVL
jgi:hypothetical protein